MSKYYVCVGRVFLYEGGSHAKAEDMLQVAINIVRESSGTVNIRSKNADRYEEYSFVNGEQR